MISLRAECQELDYTVKPTAEGRDLLAEQALARIEVIDGVEHLDGWPLPSSDNEVRNPQRISVHGRKHSFNPRTGKYEVEHDIYEYDSTLTNKYIRDFNVRCIAQGQEPLFQTREQVLPQIQDVLAQQRTEKQARFDNSFRGRLASFLGITHRVS